MSTTSRSRVFAAAATLALGSCIQGPWDYYPDNPPVYRGIWLSGYAFAGKPLQQVCMEKLLDLAEERTDAFAFFDSATVTVTGLFGAGVGAGTRTLTLAQRPDAPNCFASDTADRVAKGHDYDLTARVVWDSAGKTVVHTLTARAQVPDSFAIRRTAVAPSFSFTGSLPANIYSESFIRSLPPEVQADPALQVYLADFQNVAADSTKRLDWIKRNGKAVETRLVTLLGQYQSAYDEGDTLFYLGGILNTMSHFFTSDRSDDVAGVLITHRYDSTAERPETAFQGFFGLEPDSSEFYFPGTIRRLGLYPAATSSKGYNLLDSIGFVNTWFHTALNRIYFYGMEDAYVDYVFTAIEGAEDPRVKAEYNVSGGRGFFVGGVIDSFDVQIKVDSLTKSYSMPAVRAYECNEDGWDREAGCIEFYRPYCMEKKWEPRTCGGDAVRANLEALLRGDTLLLQSSDSAAKAVQASQEPGDTTMAGWGRTRFCVENNFPSGGTVGEACDLASLECDQPGINNCKDVMWTYCKETLWRPAACGPALAWYCRDKKRPSEVMCRQADAFCKANPDEAACR